MLSFTKAFLSTGHVKEPDPARDRLNIRIASYAASVSSKRDE
jgi:hypothetical protein